MNELEMVRWRRAERIRHAEAWSFGSSQDGAVGKCCVTFPHNYIKITATKTPSLRIAGNLAELKPYN